MKIKAYTLSETLVAIVIIGIIAAIAVPSLQNQFREKQISVRLKKQYSTLSQGLMLAISKYGQPDTWETYTYDAGDDDKDESGKTKTRYTPVPITEQLSSLKVCGYRSDGCFTTYKMMNGSNERDFESLNNRYYKLILADGSIMAFEGYEGDGTSKNAGEIWVDINGEKKPNTVGKDLFLFLWTKNGRIVPYCYNSTKETINKSCSKSSTGYCCTTKYLYY